MLKRIDSVNSWLEIAKISMPIIGDEIDMFKYMSEKAFSKRKAEIKRNDEDLHALSNAIDQRGKSLIMLGGLIFVIFGGIGLSNIFDGMQYRGYAKAGKDIAKGFDNKESTIEEQSKTDEEESK